MQDKLGFGIGMLVQRRSKQGFRSIGEGCRIFQHIVHQRYPGIIRILLEILEDENWEDFPEVKIQILRFFTRVSVTKVGCKHPLSILLFHLQNDVVLSAVSETALQQMIAILQDDGNEYSASEVRHLERYYAESLRRHKNYSAAEYHARKNLERYQEVYGRLTEHGCNLLCELAYINENLGHWELAESQYEDVLQRSQEVLDAGGRDTFSVWALRGLGMVYMRRGDSSGAEEKFQDVLRIALSSWGLEDEYTEFLIGETAESISRLGIDADAWLQQHFKLSCI
jgi:tetratricopeptide (TPR) repeat protein